MNMITPITSIGPIAGTTPTTPTLIGGPSQEGGFLEQLGAAVQAVDASQANADAVARDVATGNADPALAMVALTEAQLVLEVATAVRNRAVEAFNEIMRMPL